MARRFKRSFRRKRPRTYWLTGRTFNFATGFELSRVADPALTPFCDSAEISLFNAGDFVTAGGEGFILHRIVGRVMHLVVGTTEDGQVAILPQEGADVRRSFQAKRIWGGNSTVLDGAREHSHLFSSLELGDEDIMHTAEFIQQSNLGEVDLRIPTTVDDSLLAVRLAQTPPIDDVITNDTWSNFWADQIAPGVRDIDISCRRKVMEDSMPFLYYDVCAANGVDLLAVANPTIRLRGYLRFLVTKSSR